MLEYTKQKKYVYTKPNFFVCVLTYKKQKKYVYTKFAYIRITKPKKRKIYGKEKKEKKKTGEDTEEKKQKKKPYARLPAPLRTRHASSPVRESERD